MVAATRRWRWVWVVLLVAATLAMACPASAQSDLAALRVQMERAWNGANWPAALALLDHMRTLAPQDVTLIDRQQRGHLNYAWDLLAAGLCSQARTQFERALGLLPGDSQALQGIALTAVRCPADVPVRAPTAVAAPGGATRVLPTPSSSTAPVDRPATYTVRRGDTLYSLARRFGVTVAALQRANGLPDDAIQAGMQITIPSPAAESGARSHTVRAGETLYSLARHYGISVEAIQKVNGLSGTAIRTGMVLVIPGTEARRTHVVQTGETLYGIAARYGLSLDELMRANALAGTQIRNGQVLDIPDTGTTVTTAPAGRTHTVRAGDTLYALAQQYGTTVEAIQQANGLSGTGIPLGTVLSIP
ncbi:MAG: LysM peptidoglycan-binding domain-containing protein [Anaerolineae bacterium]